MNKTIFILIIFAFWFVTPNAIAQQVVASVNPISITAAPDDMVTVTIEIDMSATTELLGSFTGSVSWNSTFLEYQSNSGVMGGFTGVVNDVSALSAGQVFFNGTNVSGAGGTIPILEITFKVGTMGAMLDLDFSVMAAALTFTNLLPILDIQDGDIVLDAEDLSLAADILSLSPPINLPEKGKVLFRFHIPEYGMTDMKIYNTLGSLLATLTHEPFATGDHEVIWNGRDVPAGIYLVQLTHEDRVLVQKFLVSGQ